MIGSRRVLVRHAGQPRCRMVVAACTAAEAPARGRKRGRRPFAHRAPSMADTARQPSPGAVKPERSSALFARSYEPRQKGSINVRDRHRPTGCACAPPAHHHRLHRRPVPWGASRCRRFVVPQAATGFGQNQRRSIAGDVATEIEGTRERDRGTKWFVSGALVQRRLPVHAVQRSAPSRQCWSCFTKPAGVTAAVSA